MHVELCSPRVALFFDPPSHHFLGDKLFDRAFAGNAGDQILEPYAHLKDFLNARGIPVHTADYLPSSPDGVRNIYVSAGVLTNYRRLAARSDIVLSGFFAMECPTVDPMMYRELGRAQHAFKRVFSWSDSASLEPFVGGPLRCLPLKWPQSFNAVHEHVWNRGDRGFLVMLNGNKLPRHNSPCRELYSERLRAVEYFSRTDDIDLYGNGWDTVPYRVGPWHVPGTFGTVPMPRAGQLIARQLAAWRQRIVPDPRLVAARKVYRGFASSKSDTLGRYKFSLCFENSVLKGWITEKIFDCFFAGTVPVYWGAPDIEDHVPADCFIDKRRFEDYAELRAHLKALTEKDLQAYRENARAFIGSPRFEPFTKQAFAELFRRMIEEDTGMALDASAAQGS
jgi:alpha(1,3/1,4) fucosyltransferase